ncbi:glycoside hydrolase family 2 protein [Planosporangium sp. 12N6]|uniref:glycoside hydrolase family 2 protein n=1 Tax=Planosporangium spinosum TaxID=3402278 RepID=UPI003CE9B49B
MRAGSGSRVPHPVPAAVPGCVHTDLMAAGVIADPYVDDNEAWLGWIGRTDWTYETTFAHSPGGSDRTDLACAGLDTVATVSLNGVEVGRTENMHRSYRFDLRHALRPGTNTLRVAFASAYTYAERLRERLGDRPGAYPQPYQFIRKMACNFGWDWGPTVVTAGIWRPVALESWSTARLARVRPLVTVESGTGRVRVDVEVERATEESASVPLTVAATVAGVRAAADLAPGAHTATLELTVADPARWWPRGYGDQPRYPLEVTLATADGQPLDRWQRRVGFRSVRLDTTPDAHGTPFTLVVNDVPVFVRGFNWIPDDSLVSRVDRARYETRLTQAAETGANYLRVWGGGVYESDDFYDAADELGLMVGQDFLFACAAYPEEEPLRAEVAAEAADNVVRLAAHPSLVLWTGNNENIWGWHDWGWQDTLGDRTWGAGYYLDLLPEIVARLDPTRPYWPGSPWSGRPEVHPNDPAHGTSHEWEVWNRIDYPHYRDYVPRFAAEFGFQAPPAYATLRRWLSDDPLTPTSPGMLHHQKAEDGDAKLRRGLDAHLPAPRDFDDWHYLTQVNQARAVSLAVEHHRSHRPVCMGTIVWQLNDSWPATSWSAVDADGRRKPLWYALRQRYADRLLTIQPRDDALALVAVNDAATEWTGQAVVTRYTLDGTPRATYPVDLRVPARSALTCALPAEVATPGEPAAELLRVEAGDLRAWWFFAEDNEIAYPPAEYRAEVVTVPDGLRVTVTAGTVLRDLALFPDRLDPAAEVDDALVTLLPGESVTFTVRTRQPLDPAALTSRPVLRCVNDLGRSPG